jgi:hypothetical protein
MTAESAAEKAAIRPMCWETPRSWSSSLPAVHSMAPELIRPRDRIRTRAITATAPCPKPEKNFS